MSEINLTEKRLLDEICELKARVRALEDGYQNVDETLAAMNMPFHSLLTRMENVEKVVLFLQDVTRDEE